MNHKFRSLLSLNLKVHILIRCQRLTLLAQLLLVQLFLLHLAETLPASIVLHIGALHAEQGALVPAERDVASNEAATGAAIMIHIMSAVPADGIANRTKR